MSAFEGMGGILAGALGAPVTYRPEGGVEATRRWIVRVFPEEHLGGDMQPVITSRAELRVPRAQAGDIAEGDEIETAAGERFTIGNPLPTPSDASDALITFDLRRVNP